MNAPFPAIIGITLVALAFDPAAASAAAPHTGPTEPLKGVYSKGSAFVCVVTPRGDDEGRVCLYHHPLLAGKQRKTPYFSAVTEPAPRWHISQGYLWANWNDDRGKELLVRCRLDELLRGRLIAGEGDQFSENSYLQYFGDVAPLYGTWDNTRDAKFAPLLMWHDYLPAGREQVKVVILDNLQAAEKPLKGPRWGMRVYHGKNTWDAGKAKWGEETWTEDEDAEQIEVGFREPFQVLAKGEDYYFLTWTGKLYVAKKPAKGKARKMQAAYDDPKRRVVTFLQDADGGRTYLFCKAAKPGERPTFFELSEKPRPIAYDPPALKEKMHPDLAEVLRCARALDKLRLLKPAVAGK